MHHPKRAGFAALALAISLATAATAGVPKDLPYPSGDLNADQIMEALPLQSVMGCVEEALALYEAKTYEMPERLAELEAAYEAAVEAHRRAAVVGPRLMIQWAPDHLNSLGLNVTEDGAVAGLPSF